MPTMNPHLLHRLLIALCLLLTVAAAEARELTGDSSDDSFFAARGLYRVFDSASFPATFYADEAKKIAWMDIEPSPGERSWAIFDWSSATPVGFIGSDHQCFRMALDPGGFRSPGRTLAEIALDTPEPQLELAHMTRGLHVIDRFVVLNDDEAVVVFEAKELDLSVGPRDVAPPRVERAACQPMQTLLDRFSPGDESSREIDSANSSGASPMAETSRLDRNYPYTFHGAGYHWLNYQGSVFQQTKPAYDAQVTSCTSDGPGSCKPYWVTGGLFGRYGRYCGDGWGTGSGDPVSSADYCCSLHDGQSWDRSGSFGHEARNLCGFAACLTCKYYVSLSDWEVNFRGDFWATQAIDAFVAAGIAAAWCHPQSWFTGFTCN